MTDRDLIKKLGNLKEIKPDASWLKANRDSLYTQISNSGATNLTVWSSFVINFRSALMAVSTPAAALASIMLVVIASSAYAHLLLVNTKPNQSLYIAREISEKAKLTTILNTDAREKMAGQFAANNAQDITTVLSDPTFNNEQEIAKLNVKFDEEIKTVQKSVAKLDKQSVAKEATPKLLATGSDEVFSATVGKDKVGVSLVGTTTSAADNVLNTTSTTTKILEEAKSLFDNKNYTEALNKLKEVNNLIK
ncbi:MAG: hypothetical protein WCK59_02710 [Candidatus Falkowbacteria bacterium]